MTNLISRPSILSFLVLVLFGLSSAFSQPLPPVYFEDVLAKRFHAEAGKPEWTLESLCPVSTSTVARRILPAYGAMFSAHDSVTLPRTCVHAGEYETLRYQATLKIGTADIRGVSISLQSPAIEKLRAAAEELGVKGATLTALDGAIAGRRSYGDTLMLWNSRVFPALDFWIKHHRLTMEDRDALARLTLEKKIEKILEWESKGMFFSTSRSRSILTSTAPPGTSQHLALIAFDVVEYWNPEVRATLNRNGWFQTIVDDPPHFTYLGFSEADLPGRGLKAIYKAGHTYWIPNLSPKINLD